MGASSGDVRAGGAFVELYAKDGQFQKAMTAAANKVKAVGASMREYGKGLMGVGGAIAGPILASAHAFASAGAAIYDMSQWTGVAAESLSVLKYAAAQTGTDIEAVETSIKKMQKAILAASEGGDEAAKAFEMVGVSVKSLAGLTAEQQIAMIGDGLKAIEDPGTRAAVALKIFGKAGTTMLPMLASGSAGMTAFGEQARRLGLIMSSETAAKAKHLDDAFTDLKLSTGAAFKKLGAAVSPTLQSVAEGIAKSAAGAAKWISEHQGMVNLALKIGVGFIAFGTAVHALGGIVGAAAKVMKLLSASVYGVGLVLSSLPSIVRGVSVAFAFLAANPLIAILGGIALAVGALTYAFGGMGKESKKAGKQMEDSFGKAMAEMEKAKAQMEEGGDSKSNEEAMKRGESITQSLRTPMEEYNDTAKELYELFDKQAISAETLRRGLDAAEKKLNEPGIKQWEQEVSKGKSVTESVRTPEEEFKDKAAELRRLLDEQVISSETYARALDKAAKQAAEDIESGKPKTKEAEPPKFGASLGTFSSSIAGMGIAPELNKLEKPMIDTAANTAATAEALKEMVRNGGAAPAAPTGVGGVAAPMLPPFAMPTAAMSVASSVPVAASVPARSQAAMAGVEDASATRDFRGTVTEGVNQLLAVARQHFQVAKESNGYLKKLGAATSTAVAFS